MQRNNIYTIIIFLLSFCAQLSAQTVQWISWDEMLRRSKTEKRKVLIDIYQEGCLPCRNMDLHTYTNPTIANTLNTCYYAVKFDAKQRQEILYKNHNYNYTCDFGTCYHSLAFELTSGKLSFPSVVFLDENLGIVQQLPDFQEAPHFNNVMSWVCGNYYKRTSFRNYELQLKYKRN